MIINSVSFVRFVVHEMNGNVMRFTLRLLALGLGIGALASFASAQETQRLRYGTTNSIMNLPVWVAQDARLFSKHGLTNVEIIFIQSGTLITMGVVSGELNFSGAGAASVVAARLKGGDVTLLACPVDTDAVYLIARPGVKSAAELRGKIAAVTRLGSTTHFYLRSALRYAGLDPKDVERSCSLVWIFPGRWRRGRLTPRLCRSISPFLICRRDGRSCWIFRRPISFIRRPAWSAAAPLSKKARESLTASSERMSSPFTS